ncbi:hypothetical protein KSP40_PGU001003 [Platanthera guangdongensis]|uniref:Uncharacterized protein n=1 Tax=Platanthera guangdongensis TaxID=2320717 RepID=A0ABR2M1N2_9ASPA
MGIAFQLAHDGDVEADGNILFTVLRRAMGSKIGDDRGFDDGPRRIVVDAAIRHVNSPDLQAGWGIHVIQEMKLLARKADRKSLDPLIQELVDLGLQRQNLCNDAEVWLVLHHALFCPDKFEAAACREDHNCYEVW